MSNERLSEEDVKRIYITPAITNAGWRNIRMEYFTDGRVHVASNGVMTRGKRKYADYLLRYPSNINLAIVEAKDESHTPGQGLLQAVEYARLLNVPFAYSSNGHGFVEHDLITAIERELTMAEFPSPEVLRDRYIKEKALTKEQLEIIEYPFHIAQDFKPRYYQKASVDKTLEAIAKGNRRCLVVLATGTGKTYTAFQIVWKLKQMRKIKKVLYLADRNVLINKPFREEFAPFGDSRTIISKGKIDTSHEIYFGLYQQLDNEKGVSNIETYKQVSPDFFDLIIVDECHRGSAREDSNWREILEYFNSAIQVGMTATPKVYIKNVNENDDEREVDLARTYFGEPVYTYSLRQGIDDGFLAPYKVMRKFLDIDVKKYRPYKGELDIHGNLLEDREYDERDFDRKLIVDSRTHEVAEQITKYLKETDRFQKTIVFCCNINHAERLRQELWNLNLDICRKNHRYITRITGDSPTGKEDLDDFTKIEFNKDLDPCIVVSSDLMTTGVDCKTTKLIVIDKIINSVTLFKQIIGRGTRLRIADNKYEFLIMDFRRASELFTDPNWDGPVEYIDSTDSSGKRGHSPISSTENIVYHINGNKVTIMGEDVSILDADGKLTRQSLINYTKTNILNEYATLDDFIQTWSSAKKHKVIVEELAEHGVLLEQIRAELGITNMDDFDLICHIAYGMKPITRSERVKSIKKSNLLDKYTGIAREVIDRLLEKYCDEGIDDVDDIAILKLDEFKEFGTPKHIIYNIFGGRNNYISVVSIIKNNLYGGNAA